MTTKQASEEPQNGRATWIKNVCDNINCPGLANQGKDYCQIKIRLIQRRLTLIYPAELREKSPELLQYLGKFAEHHDMRILQERRTNPVEPLYECRKDEPPVLALGVGIVLQQTGLVGSKQLHLSDNQISKQVTGQRFSRLLKIAAQVCDNGKQVKIKPNRFLFGDRPNEKQYLHGYASKVVKGQESRIFSVFENEDFRAIGYTQRSNFIFHVFAGGGPSENPQIWGPLSIMTREPIHCRLYRGSDSAQSYGMLYTSYDLDMNNRVAKNDWRTPDSGKIKVS